VLLQWKLRAKCLQGPCVQYKYTAFFLSLRRHEFSWPVWELGSQWPTTVQGGRKSLKGSHRMEDGQIFLKTSAPLSLIENYRMNLLSAGSISQESTFKVKSKQVKTDSNFFFYDALHYSLFRWEPSCVRDSWRLQRAILYFTKR
jgi:hypothetical protein